MAALVDGGMVQVDWKDVKNAALALQVRVLVIVSPIDCCYTLEFVKLF